MKIWCVSDTHTAHKQLVIPEGIDMVIHSGDASSTRGLSFNEAELREFLRWYDALPVTHKIYVPGNHDTSIENRMFNLADYPDITFLIHESVEINGVKIFGSPYTPSFGIGWAYNVKRSKIEEYWKQIPADTDIIVTHGPAKGILDYTADGNSTFRQCGCKALLNAIKRVSPEYHIFGHIHNESDVLNCGVFKPNGYDTSFVNAAVMNLAYKVVNNGIVIDYETFLEKIV